MRKGFTLVEIMIVVAIIAILATFALPGLLRSRVTANESAAIAGLRTIVTAMESWRAANGSYSGVTLNALGSATPPYIDKVLGCSNAPCNKTGYMFYNPNIESSNHAYYANAAPITVNVTGKRYFCVTEDGVIRYDSSAIGSHSDCLNATPIE